MKQNRKTTILTVATILFASIQGFSQKDSLKNKPEIITIHYDGDEGVLDEDKIYIYVKTMPEFPGGINALRKYIYEHLRYPSVARECAIQGTVYLRFEVKKDGSIGKVQLQKGVDPLMDEEAIRVIKTLPNFKPGEQNGKKVNVWYSIPVTFKLN